MARPLKVACVQNCATPDVERSSARALVLSRRAIAGGAQLVCLPEYFSGLETKDGAFHPAAFEEPAHPVLRGGAHPADHEVLSRVQHNFDLRCLPACFGGLRTAPVVLLYLSPGLSKPDYLDGRTRRGRARYRRRWRGEQPLPGPGDHEPAWRWWENRAKCFGDWQELQTKVAILNIGAYHSKTFTDTPLLAALPSSRVSIDWAQHVLFPEAMAGTRVVVCLRAARFWGLQEGKRYGKALFAPAVTRGGHMKRGRMRNAVIREVKAILAAPSPSSG